MPFQEGEIIYRKGTDDRFIVQNGRPVPMPSVTNAAAALQPNRDPDLPEMPLTRTGGMLRFAREQSPAPAPIDNRTPSLLAYRQESIPNMFARPSEPNSGRPTDPLLHKISRVPALQPILQPAARVREAGTDLVRYGAGVQRDINQGAQRAVVEGARRVADVASIPQRLGATLQPLVTPPQKVLTPAEAAWYLQQSAGDEFIARQVAEDDGFKWPGD